MTTVRMLGFVAAGCVLLFAGCDESRAPIEISGATMGTQYHGASQAIELFFYTLAAFALAVAAMAVGVIINHRRLAGSCGGLAGLQDASGRPLCEVCSHPSEDCRLSLRESNEPSRRESRPSAGD